MTRADTYTDMKYLDHSPGHWFLLEWHGALYLDYRYSYSAFIDDSGFMKLNDDECHQYDARGHEYLSELAEAAHYSAPYRKESSFYTRNLYFGPDSKKLRAAVSAAITDHTWAAEQRRKHKS